MTLPDRTVKRLSDLLDGGVHWRASDAAMLASQQEHGRPEHGFVWWDTVVDFTHDRYQQQMERSAKPRDDSTLALYAALPVLTLWRLTKGLYQFEPELLNVLLDGDTGPLPVTLLRQLPEYAPFISLSSPDAPGTDIAGTVLAGRRACSRGSSSSSSRRIPRV